MCLEIYIAWIRFVNTYFECKYAWILLWRYISRHYISLLYSNLPFWNRNLLYSKVRYNFRFYFLISDYISMRRTISYSIDIHSCRIRFHDTPINRMSLSTERSFGPFIMYPLVGLDFINAHMIKLWNNKPYPLEWNKAVGGTGSPYMWCHSVYLVLDPTGKNIKGYKESLEYHMRLDSIVENINWNSKPFQKL